MNQRQRYNLQLLSTAVYHQLRKKYLGIRTEITNRTSLETVDLLKRGQVDFGFINLPFEDDLLSITTCCEVHDILIGGIEYKQLSYTGVSYAELSRYPLVMLERKSISRLCIDDFFENAGISLSPVLELGSLDLIISSCKVFLKSKRIKRLSVCYK